jgi:hypothetical protein
LKEAPVVPKGPIDRRHGRGRWQIRWWALLAIAGVLIAVAIPSIVASINEHRGSRPAAVVDDQREVVVRLSWDPGTDALYPDLPAASLTFRTVESGPELAHALVKWPLAPNTGLDGVGTDHEFRANPGTLIAVTGTVDRVQVYFVASIYGTGKPVAHVDLNDGIGPLPDLHGIYTMVILGTWQAGTIGFTQTVHFAP